MNLPSIIEEVYKALRSLFKWSRVHGQRVLNAVAVTTALAVAWQFWFSFGERPFVMFIGAPGSSTAIIGPKLVKEIARTRDSNGVNYRIALEPTPDNLSIRERMAFETNRIPLGIVDDGQTAGVGQAEDLRALLPLEWDYLYVLCSHTLLNEVVAAKNKASDEAHKTARPAKKSRTKTPRSDNPISTNTNDSNTATMKRHTARASVRPRAVTVVC